MSGVAGIGGVDRVMALRAQILERNQALARANTVANAPAAAETGGAASASSFADRWAGSVAPQSAVNRVICALLRIGRIPGVIGAVTWSTLVM